MNTPATVAEAVLRRSLPLFVYGTLRRGEVNHTPFLGGRFTAVLPARLEDHVRCVGSHGYFVVRPQAHAQVEGELFFLDPAEDRTTLEACDRLEEIPPGELQGAWYARRIVTVWAAGTTHQAWIYLDAAAAG
jgi:gamma-glutamylcyclotransferase (GGCT)/AIG2-like uncharacterized protein YtfP